MHAELARDGAGRVEDPPVRAGVAGPPTLPLHGLAGLLLLARSRVSFSFVLIDDTHRALIK